MPRVKLVYIIELVKKDQVVGLGILEKGGVIMWTAPTPGGYQHCSKFKEKPRAETIAAKLETKYRQWKDDKSVVARVVPEFGGPSQGEKSSVPEKKKDRVRR